MCVRVYVYSYGTKWCETKQWTSRVCQREYVVCTNTGSCCSFIVVVVVLLLLSWWVSEWTIKNYLMCDANDDDDDKVTHSISVEYSLLNHKAMEQKSKKCHFYFILLPTQTDYSTSLGRATLTDRVRVTCGAIISIESHSQCTKLNGYAPLLMRRLLVISRIDILIMQLRSRLIRISQLGARKGETERARKFNSKCPYSRSFVHVQRSSEYVWQKQIKLKWKTKQWHSCHWNTSLAHFRTERINTTQKLINLSPVNFFMRVQCAPRANYSCSIVSYERREWLFKWEQTIRNEWRQKLCTNSSTGIMAHSFYFILFCSHFYRIRHLSLSPRFCHMRPQHRECFHVELYTYRLQKYRYCELCGDSRVVHSHHTYDVNCECLHSLLALPLTHTHATHTHVTNE